MVQVKSAYGSLPTTVGEEPRTNGRNSWILPAVTALAAALVAGTAIILIAATPTGVELEQKRHHSLANNYRSSADARNDLNAYFDSQKMNTKRHGLSASEANSQLSQIWKTSADAKIAKVRSLQHKQVMQDLAFSSHAAQDDLDSYFDEMDDSHPKAHHEHHESGEIRKNWNAHSAENDMDNYWDTLSAKEGHKWHHQNSHAIKPSQAQIAEAKSKALKEYRSQHPEFAKKLDQIHIDWMKTHDQPPTGTMEKSQYEKQVKKVEQGVHLQVTKYLKEIMAHPEAKEDKPNLRKEALVKYLDSHPDVKAKMSKAKKEWMEEYGGPPKGNVQMKKYHDLMKHIVGHVDISIKDTLGVKASTLSGAQKEPSQAEKVKALKEFEHQNPEIKDKIAKVHKLWAQKHTKPPSTPAEEAEYGELMKKYVVPTVATVSAASEDLKKKSA
eukprot:CAMPEP_0181326896 /NCGR_PEP_ID=MMETSP1101-20121128/21774_1 /TAXON_ID=46948 /ORGANISM="Rhodomonas abbreviata, Strain Caron Lab Isolate" /LENGTH=440 /DNA_ID=CAMNT_0023435443 /DNA_START=15 /DNA_END=1337 /DNA_ORIENTATION=+